MTNAGLDLLAIEEDGLVLADHVVAEPEGGAPHARQRALEAFRNVFADAAGRGRAPDARVEPEGHAPQRLDKGRQRLDDERATCEGASGEPCRLVVEGSALR